MIGPGRPPLRNGEDGDPPPAGANQAVLGAGFVLTVVVALVIALVAMLVPGDRSECPSANANESNRLVRMATVGDIVEIELWSEAPFPVRALRPVLRIGDAEFLLSRNPGDGRLDTLIFTVPGVDFASLRAGDSVTVYHGQMPSADLSPGETDGWNAWAFEPFDPSLLDCGSSRS